MTTKAVESSSGSGYLTHGEGKDRAPHEWRYLGRVAQTYLCTICQLRVSKSDLKAATDA